MIGLGRNTHEVLDSKLAIYKPLNIGAWQWLQSTVTERKELSLDVIQQWYEAEKNTGMK